MIEYLRVRKREYIRVLERAQKEVQNSADTWDVYNSICSVIRNTNSQTIKIAAYHLAELVLDRTNNQGIIDWLVENGVSREEITKEKLNAYNHEWIERLKWEVLES